MPGRYTEPRVARSADNDPKCNPSLLQDDQTGTPTPSYEYQATCPNDQNLVYVHGRAVKGKPLSPPRPDRHGIPEQELGDVRALQPADRGLGRHPRGRADRRRRRVRATRSTRRTSRASYAKHVVMRTDRTDGLVVRNMLLKRRARARLLHRGDRRRPARQGQVLLERRLRPPELHDRPQRDPELRGVRRRRRRRLPGRVAADRRVPRRGVLSRAALQHGRPLVRPARLDARLLGLDGQLGAHHREPHLRQHDRHRERHAVGARPSRLPGRRHADRQQLHLLQQPRPLRRRTRRSSRSCRCRSAPASSGRG